MGSTALFTLGNLYISDFVKPDVFDGERHELALVFDDDGAVKLPRHIPINKMFGKYWYRSGTNDSMKHNLKDIVDSILKLKDTGYYPYRNKAWLDIASNDGTLLSYVPTNYYRIGIDPCEDSFLEEAKQNAEIIIQDYFSAELVKKYRDKIDIITSIAVFYDIVEREKFLKHIYDILDDNGLWVLQMSYTPLMLQQMAFDNICHEHYYYYSLSNIKKLLERHGFKIMDCQLNDVNGGSFRLYVMKQTGDDDQFSSQPNRDVCTMRINSLLEYEKHIEIDAPRTWMKFFSDTLTLCRELNVFIKTQKLQGKTIYGYGASTKGNTLLQFCGLDSRLITAIADRSPYKIGLKTIGTNIPIISEEEMRKARPDYLLILPWHFISEFEQREKEYLKNGGHFIVPCPKLKII